MPFWLLAILGIGGYAAWKKYKEETEKVAPDGPGMVINAFDGKANWKQGLKIGNTLTINPPVTAPGHAPFSTFVVNSSDMGKLGVAPFDPSLMSPGGVGAGAHGSKAFVGLSKGESTVTYYWTNTDGSQSGGSFVVSVG